MNFNKYLIDNNISCARLAEATGFNESAIYHWQAGTREPSIATERYLLLLEKVKRETGEWPLGEHELTPREKRWCNYRKSEGKLRSKVK